MKFIIFTALLLFSINGFAFNWKKVTENEDRYPSTRNQWEKEIFFPTHSIIKFDIQNQIQVDIK